MMWAIAVILVSLAVAQSAPAAGRSVADPNLRSHSLILDHVRAQALDEKEAFFSFALKGKKQEFVLVKNTESGARNSYGGLDSNGFENTLAIVFGGFERPMLRGFVKIDGILYSIQPSNFFLKEFPELKGSGATVAIPQKVLVELYYGIGEFNSTVPIDRGDRKRATAPDAKPLTVDAPDAEPPLPCPTDGARKQIVIDTVTDGDVYARAQAALPAGATQQQILDYIKEEVIVMVDWMGNVYGAAHNVFFKSGTIRSMTGYDSTGAGWNSGSGTGWNRACTGDRDTWYGDTLNSFSCWIDGQSDLDGALVQLLHGCTFSGGGTVGLAWLGVTCRGSSRIQGGGQCVGKGSVSSYSSRALYIIATHELGHNHNLNHNANGIMTPSVGSFTEFSRESQHAYCSSYPQNAGRCATDLIEGCECPASWECGTLCGADCPGKTCPTGQDCIDNTCVVPCQPNCGPGDSFQCGASGCDEDCGTCDENSFCNDARQCEALSGDFSDHATLINNERARWGSSQDFDVSASLSNCLAALAPGCADSFSYDWSCSGGTYLYTAGHFSPTFLDDYQAIQFHLNSVLERGDHYDCETDSFATSTFQNDLYLRYIHQKTGTSVGYAVRRGCSWGGEFSFSVSIVWAASSDTHPTIADCPGGDCTPTTCSAALSCDNHGNSDGCGGTQSCACPAGQSCYESSCCVGDSCMANEFQCGTVDAGCGLEEEEDCGSCSGGETCYIKSGETGGECCTATTCEAVGCGVALSAEDNCGVALDCGCGSGEECKSNAADSNTCCVPETCDTISAGCGTSIPNGCGNGVTIDCLCSSGSCFNGECCTPLTCDTVSVECGNSVSDGCGSTLSCSCAGGQSCVAGVCQADVVCDSCPVGAVCGAVDCSDGSSVSCGSCALGERCSTDLTECECVPLSKEEACASVSCGSVSNGCDGTFSCDDTCNAATHVCVEGTNSCCALATCPPGKECGSIEVGCGTGLTVNCGSNDGGCAAGESCNEDTCECPDPCEPNSCAQASNACGTVDCNSCIEGYMCDVLNAAGPSCVPEEDCCTCLGDNVWSGSECVPEVTDPRGCQGGWSEQNGFLWDPALALFTPVQSEACPTTSAPVQQQCLQGMPICGNLYIFDDFTSSSLGDGVAVEVRDTGDNGIMGLFMHGSGFVNDSDTVASRYWAGFIDRSNDKLGMGIWSMEQVRSGRSGISTSYTNGISTRDYDSSDNRWYRIALQRPRVEFNADYCALVFSVQLGGRTQRRKLYFFCSQAESIVGNGGQFGLISSMSAEFRNFVILSASHVRFNMYFPFCPSSSNVQRRMARLLGLRSSQISDINVGCGTDLKRQAVASGASFPVSFTINSEAAPAASLASRLEYLMASGKGGVAFDASAGFTTTAGGPPGGSGVPPTVEPAFSPTVVNGGGGGGGGAGAGAGGSGGLSGGAIAGIVVGSFVGVAALVAVGVVVAKKQGEDGGSGMSSSAGAEGGKNKGVPVMNPESHQRRVIEEEMTSVTGRTAPH